MYKDLGHIDSTIDTAGDLLIQDAQNQHVRLPIGTEAQVLTVSGGAPAWTAGGGGGDSFKTIATDAGTNPVADSATDTLTLTSSDSSVTITGDSAADSVDFVAAIGSFSIIQTPTGTSPAADASNDTLTLTSTDGSVTITGDAGTDTIDFSAPAGDVVGPGSATDNDIARFDSTTGKLIKAGLAYDAANTASAVVQRDGSGNFSAGTITAALLGNATTATTATNFSGSLSGDVTGTQSSTSIAAATVTGKVLTGFSAGAGTVAATDTILEGFNKLAGNDASFTTGPGSATDNDIARFDGTTGKLIKAGLAYTSANTVSTVVQRDGSGNFSAGTITAALSGNATTATSATTATTATNLSAGTASAADGSSSAPAYTFASDTDLGIYRYGANELGFTLGNTPVQFSSPTNQGLWLGTTLPGTITSGTLNSVTGSGNTAAGITSGSRITVIGTNNNTSATSSINQTIVGASNTLTSGSGGTGNVLVGASLTSAYGRCALIGAALTATASHQFIVGDGANMSTDYQVFFGGTVTSTATSATIGTATVQVPGCSGTNKSSPPLRLAGGKNTGSGTPGSVYLATGTVGGSGTTLSSLTDRLEASESSIICLGTELKIDTAGKGLSIKEGTNARMGASALSSGTVTVSTTAVTANSRIFLTPQTSGGTPGFVGVSTRTAGTSFTITSSSGSDTSTIAWMIVEPL